MPKLKVYNKHSIKNYFSIRQGEQKFGETIGFVASLEELPKKEAEFVIFGIPEDIGVRGNYGKPGTSKAWNSCLKSLLNTQRNQFNQPENLILLGEIDCSEEMRKASFLEDSDPNYYVKLGELVEKIDETVAATVEKIILAGKTPVIIGGGHNNAFGNIKGASQAYKKPINVMNIDAHTDLRRLEHRHSGNGFSYAKKEGFLRKYSIFGIDENYTPEYIFEEINASADIEYCLFEEHPASEKDLTFRKYLDFVASEKFGLEIDCDAMANFPSSAVSPSGFTLDEVRFYLRMAAQVQNCIYLHLCEAIATENFPTGKSLSVLVTDFIKSKKNV